MTTLAEQVAEVEVGDYAEVVIFLNESESLIVRGILEEDACTPPCLEIKGRKVRLGTGEPDANLTSIHRVPRPISSEPEVGSFALLDDGDVSQRKQNLQFPHCGWHRGEAKRSWPEIYPHIVRLYTPSGELVTGFEYAGGDKG